MTQILFLESDDDDDDDDVFKIRLIQGFSLSFNEEREHEIHFLMFFCSDIKRKKRI